MPKIPKIFKKYPHFLYRTTQHKKPDDYKTKKINIVNVFNHEEEYQSIKHNSKN